MASRTAVAALCVLAFAATAFAQPAIFTNGIVNGASFVPAGLPNSSIAQGSIFTIFGNGLAAVTKQVSDEGFPLKTASDGTTVDINAGGNSYKALLLFIAPGQINAILPSAVPTGTASVTVTTAAGTSNAQSIAVARSSFGIITRNSAGSGPGIVFNYNSNTDQPINAVTEAAHPGQVLVLWGTGLGPVSFDESRQPVQGNLDTAVEVWIGGQKVTPQYKGRSLYAGLDQINFQLPPDGSVPTGCYVPVTVKAGTVVSNAATIAIAPEGQRACSDPISFGGRRADQISGGLRLGTILLNRTVLSMGADTFTTDLGIADFSQYTAASLLASHGQFGVSAVNSCVTYTYRGSTSDFNDPVSVQGIDAGNELTLTLPGSNGTKTLARVAGQTGAYATPFDLSGGTLPAPWLGPGNYTIAVPGATPGVGAFTATLNVPNALMWTNMAAIEAIPRNAGLSVTWSGGDPTDLVLISGASDANRVGAGFYCLSQNTGSFTVPVEILSVLPVTGTGQDDTGILLVGSVPPATRPGVAITPAPQGLDAAMFMYVFSSGKLVQYQ